VIHHHATAPTLAAAARSPTANPSLTGVYIAIAVLIAVAIAAGVAFMLIRKYALSDPERTSAPLTLGGLRDMLKRGEITQEEFDKARDAIIAAHANPNKAPTKSLETPNKAHDAGSAENNERGSDRHPPDPGP
jgi:hypothetical protein